jgi:hypothetical protein
MTHAELRRLARIGAEARLEALEREIAAIYAVFPELRTGRSAPNEGVREALQGAVTRRRRPRLSPPARKRIAEAQRKRWAEEGEASGSRCQEAEGIFGRQATEQQ